MNEFFRRQSLSFKLILIGIIPLAFILYLTFEVYKEKNKNITIIENSIDRVNRIGDITNLIHQLQQEQKFSFDVLRKDTDAAALTHQRKQTDTALQKLSASGGPVVKGFEQYTSLKDLTATRARMDSGSIPSDQLTHFYSSAIFRLNTLISIPYNSIIALAPFYSDIVSQKLLTEIITYLSIISSNIYNVLTTRQYMVETLLGTMGAYDVYRSYDTELTLKANEKTLAAYNKVKADAEVKSATRYIDQLFKTFKFDSTYNAAQWWMASGETLGELLNLRENIWQKLNKDITAAHQHEVGKRNGTLLLLIFITVIVLGFVAYTIAVITTMLSELKRGAEKIALGGSDLQFNIHSKDAIGSLADSISKIAASNKQLSLSAEEIGKGNFEAVVHTRSEDDLLANAISTMKLNLQVSMQALKESEEHFRKLADLMPQIVWTTDATGKIDYVNNQWTVYAGNQDMVDVIHPDDAPENANRWANAVDDHKDFVAEIRLRNHITKEYRWFLVRAIPVADKKGNVSKWFGTSTDIHDRKSISEALEKMVQKRTIELKRSNEELMQFAHVASHDMKEPLRKINVFSGMLVNELGDSVPVKAKLYVDKMKTATERLINLIDGVLKYSSVNHDERPFEQVDLNEILSAIVSDLEISIQQKNAVIKYSKLPVINGIPVLIHQLFFNLIVNALKFSKADISPEINIVSSVIKLKDVPVNTALSLNDNHLQIIVRDNGIGFGEDFCNQVFNVFVRLNSRDKYDGTGLGLALCKKIMERHEGAIYAESQEGNGAAFYLLFPETAAVADSNGALVNAL